jgi:hypothetical protein
MHDAEYAPAAVDAYGFLKANGRFRDGVVPEMAPRPDMVRWDI